jgi:hypothetical protein
MSISANVLSGESGTRLPVLVAVALALTFVLSHPLGAQAPPQAATRTSAPAGPLPVRRVVLYKSGVGYFEHLGRSTIRKIDSPCFGRRRRA